MSASRHPIQVPRSEGAEALLAALETAVDAAGGARRFALAHGLNDGQLCNVRCRREHPTARIAEAIGWEKVVLYRPATR